MAVALKEGRSIRNVEAIAERPDGSRIPFIPFPTPLRDSDGRLVGAINMLIDISERKQAESNQQMLLSELNHRAKNNMKIMQSLLETAGRKIKSSKARGILEQATNRIAAMAAAQRVLYETTDATRFRCERFLPVVCNAAQGALPNARIVCESTNRELSNDASVPLALLVNELITNAAKHAPRGPEPVHIRVRLGKDGDHFVLCVEDDGPGFDFESVRKRSSGLRLVRGFARQLGGDFSAAMNPTRCSVRFRDKGI